MEANGATVPRTLGYWKELQAGDASPEWGRRKKLIDAVVREEAVLPGIGQAGPRAARLRPDARRLPKAEQALAQMDHPSFLTYLKGKMGAV